MSKVHVYTPFSRRSSEYCTQCTQDSQKHNTFLPTYLFVHFVLCFFFFVYCFLSLSYSFFFLLLLQFSSLTFIHQSWTWRNNRIMIIALRCLRCQSVFLCPGTWHNEVVVLLNNRVSWCDCLAVVVKARKRDVIPWDCKLVKSRTQCGVGGWVQIICLLFSISQAVLTTTIWVEDNLLLYC